MVVGVDLWRGGGWWLMLICGGGGGEWLMLICGGGGWVVDVDLLRGGGVGGWRLMLICGGVGVGLWVVG